MLHVTRLSQTKMTFPAQNGHILCSFTLCLPCQTSDWWPSLFKPGFPRAQHLQLQLWVRGIQPGLNNCWLNCPSSVSILKTGPGSVELGSKWVFFNKFCKKEIICALWGCERAQTCDGSSKALICIQKANPLHSADNAHCKTVTITFTAAMKTILQQIKHT